MAPLSIPTTARLPSTLRVDSSNPAVLKSLGRLSREGLISLALDWLEESSLPNAFPYLRRPVEEDEDEADDDEDDLYPPCRSVRDLEQLYTELQEQKGSKRDIVSRILEGDWRHGMTLYQLAMADLAYLDEHQTSQKWTAYRIHAAKKPEKDVDDQVLKIDKKSLDIPRFHPSTFLQNLQAQVLPDVKAHYQFHRPTGFPVLLLRIFVIDSPYNSELALSNTDSSGTAASFDSSRTVYIAFPDGAASLYISRSQSTGPIGQGESKSLHSLIVDGVPKALSRPRERFILKSANLTSRNLGALLDKRGSGRGNAAGGGWSIYSDEKSKDSPADTTLPTPPPSREFSLAINTRKRDQPAMGQTEQIAKRAKFVARARFGSSAVVTDGKGVEKLDVVLQDAFPAPLPPDREDEEEEEELGANARGRASRRRSKVDVALQQASNSDDENSADEDGQNWTPSVKITFSGAHVFAGIRQLVESGIVDGERMPGWMTGEEGVTVGVVKHGRIKGHRGSGS